VDPARIITELGGAGVTVALGAGLLVTDPPTGLTFVSATVTTALAVEALKVTLGRARPYVPGENGRFTGPKLSGEYHSMPSGHTANAFAMATVLADRYPEGAGLFYTLAGLVGASRIALGVHWPSDVVAGAAIGSYIGSRAVSGHIKILDLSQ
jgi:undecaprenyl-diphosphatase